MQNQVKLFEILLVEDDPADVDLTQIALSRCQLQVTLQVATNGDEAIDYLHQKQQRDREQLPDLILLDLNLPGLSGREVLQFIKTDDRLKHIPIVVLTSSDSEQDIFKSYKLGANCYVTKPLGLREFEKIARSIEDFWFTVVKLPKSI